MSSATEFVSRETTTVPVSEVFGPVFQGEGPHTGRLCSFVRLGLCNLRCSWCDTPYTWDTSRFDVAAECPPTTAREIAAQLAGHGTRLLILSGGEPTLHRANGALRHLLEDLWGHDVHVETNGTLIPSDWMDRRVTGWSVSPKLEHTGDPLHRRIHPEALAWYAAHADSYGDVAFKFVVTGPDDLAAVHALVAEHSLRPEDVWIMPEGTDALSILTGARLLADPVAAAGFNLTLRQQTLLYGSERAR